MGHGPPVDFDLEPTLVNGRVAIQTGGGFDAVYLDEAGRADFPLSPALYEKDPPVRVNIGQSRLTMSIAMAVEAPQILLRVSDTRIGMADDQRPYIFDRFFRCDDERVRGVAGSGLGLTLVKAHVDAHAGTIRVDSTPGDGSTFLIALPLAAVESP